MSDKTFLTTGEATEDQDRKHEGWTEKSLPSVANQQQEPGLPQSNQIGVQSVTLSREGIGRLTGLLHEANQLLISLPQEGYALGEWHLDLRARISEELRLLYALQELRIAATQ